MMQPSSAIEQARDAIRSFLQRYPHGADTLEGVAQWWLGGAVAPETVAAALEQLRAAGELEQIRAGQRQVWRRRRPAA